MSIGRLFFFCTRTKGERKIIWNIVLHHNSSYTIVLFLTCQYVRKEVGSHVRRAWNRNCIQRANLSFIAKKTKGDSIEWASSIRIMEKQFVFIYRLFLCSDVRDVKIIFFRKNMLVFWTMEILSMKLVIFYWKKYNSLKNNRFIIIMWILYNTTE